MNHGTFTRRGVWLREWITRLLNDYNDSRTRSA
jgi:hypothetical protein